MAADPSSSSSSSLLFASVSLERGISGTLDSKGDVEVESTVYVTPGAGAEPVKVVMEVAEPDEELLQAEGEDLPPRIFAYLNDSDMPLSVMIQDYNQVDPRVETIVDREMVPVQLLGRSFETFHLQMCGAQLKMVRAPRPAVPGDSGGLTLPACARRCRRCARSCPSSTRTT